LGLKTDPGPAGNRAPELPARLIVERDTPAACEARAASSDVHQSLIEPSQSASSTRVTAAEQIGVAPVKRPTGAEPQPPSQRRSLAPRRGLRDTGAGFPMRSKEAADQSSKRCSRSGRRSMIARARSCSLPCTRSRNGAPACTCKSCLRAIPSITSRSSGCLSTTSLILSRRRAFLRRNVSGSRGAGVAPSILSGLAKGSGGGCNFDGGFCGMSGKSGGSGDGLTGGLGSSHLGITFLPRTVSQRGANSFVPNGLWVIASTDP
jgi:hypothetical protein